MIERFLAAACRLLNISDYTTLYSRLGQTYGGTGTTFALPDADGRPIVGAGTGPGLSPRTLCGKQGTTTETLTLAEMPLHSHTDPDTLTQTDTAGGTTRENNVQPEIALRYLITTEGLFPPPSGFLDDSPAVSFVQQLGEVAIFAGNATEVPRGWAFAEGQLFSIPSDTALFAVLGTQFGGDGRVNFRLPDLRGRTPVGAGGRRSDLRRARVRATAPILVVSSAVAAKARPRSRFLRSAAPPG